MDERPDRAHSSRRPDVRGKRSKPIIRIVLVAGVLAALGFLFVRSVQDTRAAPYTVGREHLGNLTVTLEPTGTNPGAPILALRTAPELASRLFRQVFTRAMESLSAPTTPAIPLVLQGEFDRAFAGRMTPEALAAAARTAGLETAPFEPRCLGYRRVSEPRATRQLYFVLFDAPAFGEFRHQLATLLEDSADSGAVFHPDALSPVLLIAASDAMFPRWLPLRADPEGDCVAPVIAE